MAAPGLSRRGIAFDVGYLLPGVPSNSGCFHYQPGGRVELRGRSLVVHVQSSVPLTQKDRTHEVLGTFACATLTNPTDTPVEITVTAFQTLDDGDTFSRRAVFYMYSNEVMIKVNMEKGWGDHAGSFSDDSVGHKVCDSGHWFAFVAHFQFATGPLRVVELDNEVDTSILLTRAIMYDPYQVPDHPTHLLMEQLVQEDEAVSSELSEGKI